MDEETVVAAPVEETAAPEVTVETPVEETAAPLAEEVVA